MNLAKFCHPSSSNSLSEGINTALIYSKHNIQIIFPEIHDVASMDTLINGFKNYCQPNFNPLKKVFLVVNATC